MIQTLFRRKSRNSAAMEGEYQTTQLLEHFDFHFLFPFNKPDQPVGR